MSPSSICSDLGSRLWPAHAPYNDSKHFFRICSGKSGLSNAYGVRSQIQFLNHWEVVAHLVDSIDKCLGVTFLQVTNLIDRVPAREDRLDRRNELALENITADQPPQYFDGGFHRCRKAEYSSLC